MPTAAYHYERAEDLLKAIKDTSVAIASVNNWHEVQSAFTSMSALALVAQAELDCARFILENSDGDRLERFNSELRIHRAQLPAHMGAETHIEH